MTTPLASPELRLVQAWLGWRDRSLADPANLQMPSWRPNDALCDRFLHEAHRSHFMNWGFDDLQLLAHSALSGPRPLLLESYQRALTALDPEGDGMALDDDPPSMSPIAWLRWRELAGVVAADGLVCLHAARRGSATATLGWTRWRSLPGVLQPSLQHLQRRHGWHDLHVHLGGAYDKHLAWLQWLWGFIPDRMAMAPRFVVRPTLGLVQGPGLERRDQDVRREEQALFATARRAFHLMLHESLVNFGSAGRDRSESMCRDARRAAARLQQQAHDMTHSPPEAEDEMWMFRLERLIMTTAWKRLLDGKESTLDRYLSARQYYLRECQQYPDKHTPPGLSVFRQYLDRARGHERWHRSAHSQARYAALGPIRQLAATGLSGLELRISPMASVADYVHFLRGMERHCGQGLTPRFVVHFLRQPLEPGEAWSRLRVLLDRQTAVLHQFRLRFPALARQWLVGVDVANLERDCPPAVMLPYLRWLRDPSVASELLTRRSTQREAPQNANRGFHQWYGMVQRHLALAPAGAGSLGMTYHVGEDNPHPVNGMRQVVDVLEFGGVRVGDRLGHAVALGQWTPELMQRFVDRPIKLFDALMDLLWLHRHARQHPPQPAWEQMLTSRRDELLGRLVPNLRVPDPWKHLRLWRALIHQPIPGHCADLLTANDSEEELRQQLPDCREPLDGHRQWVPAGWLYAELDDLVEKARISLLQTLDERGVLTEMPPSSNWTTQGLSQLKQHPLLREWARQRSLRLSVCTDDPGVFHTRLDIEWGLVWGAMQEMGLPQRDIEATVSDWMDVTARAMFGQRQAAHRGA